MSIEIHPLARVSHLAEIEDSIKGSRIVVSEHSVIDSFVKIKPAGGLGDLFIGPESYINSGCVIYTGNGISIGRGVLIAANCSLCPTNHEFSSVDEPIRCQGFSPSRGGIVIEDDVWIGANCVILDGAHIGKGSVIAAGSVVRGKVPSMSVYGGHPLRLLKKRE